MVTYTYINNNFIKSNIIKIISLFNYFYNKVFYLKILIANYDLNIKITKPK